MDWICSIQFSVSSAMLLFSLFVFILLSDNAKFKMNFSFTKQCGDIS